LNIRFGPVDKRFVGGSKVGTAGVCRIIRGVDGLSWVLGIGCIGGRRAAVEVTIAAEDLSDQLRAHDLAVLKDQAAIRPAREQHLRDPGHGQWIDETSYQGQGDDEDDRRSDFSPHDCSPQARCKAVTAKSMALIPMNGTIMPPSP